MVDPERQRRHVPPHDQQRRRQQPPRIAARRRRRPQRARSAARETHRGGPARNPVQRRPRSPRGPASMFARPRQTPRHLQRARIGDTFGPGERGPWPPPNNASVQRRQLPVRPACIPRPSTGGHRRRPPIARPLICRQHSPQAPQRRERPVPWLAGHPRFTGPPRRTQPADANRLPQWPAAPAHPACFFTIDEDGNGHAGASAASALHLS